MIKRAMILAAGFGKRLHPLTLDCPKPLLKLGNETLLSNTINFLEQLEISQIVINVHYLKNHIIKYLNKKKFRSKIIIIEEKGEILDTGGGVLNSIKYFFNEPFLIINPDTIWSLKYMDELKKMKNFFLNNKETKALLLIVNKDKSFDTSFKGDFNLENNFVTRKNQNNLKYIYTGLQIIKPEVFSNFSGKIFSMNKIWDKLIINNQLLGMESNINFFHVSTLNVYKNLIEKDFKH